MTILWVVSLILRNASIIDVFWGLGFVISDWFFFAFTPEGFFQRKILVSTLVTIWGLRLSLHILLRNWGKPEDFRYHKWREEEGSSWWWKSLLRVFLLQGFLIWIISIPLLVGQISPSPSQFTWVDGLGLAVWMVGFFFEAAGDWQLKRFKSNPENKGKVLSGGVWRYTRHPNYFGDAAQWWGYYLIAAATFSGWWTIYSPIIMTFFLIKISGVAMLEKSLVNSRDGYHEYINTTSSFLPWFPKKTK